MIHKSKNGLYISYLRVSSEKQTHGVSIESQRQINNAFIESVGGRLLKEFISFESAWVQKRLKGKERKEFKEMVQLSKETDAPIVIAYDSRFARDVELVARSINQKIKFIDAKNPHRTEESFLQNSVSNQYVSEKISESTRAALALKKLRGEPLGANTHKKKQDMRRMRAQRMRIQSWHFLSTEKAIILGELVKEYDERFEKVGIFAFDKVKPSKRYEMLFPEKTMRKILKQINTYHLKVFEPENKAVKKWNRQNFMLYFYSYCKHCRTYRLFFGNTPVDEAEQLLDMDKFTDEQYEAFLNNPVVQRGIKERREKEKKRLKKYDEETKFIEQFGYSPKRKETRGRPRKVVED